MSLPVVQTDVVDGPTGRLAYANPEQFVREVAAVTMLGFGPGGHSAAVELMARTLRQAGFGEGVDALERRGLLREPERSCQMAFATGEVCP